MINVGQNRIPDKICPVKFFHPETPHNMKIPNMYFLKNRTTGQKTGFRDPGHQNWHKPCQNGTEQYCEGFRMIDGIKTQTVEIRGTQQIFRELHIIKIWSSKKG